MSERLQPAIWGGLFIGVLSALPFVNLPNYCCCCLWVLVGGALAAYLRQQNSPYQIDAAEGAIVGLMAGAIGGVIYSILSIPLQMVVGPMLEQWTERMMSQNPDVTPEMRDMFQRLSTSSGARLLSVLVTLVVDSIFGMLGGLIGVAIFKRNLPPPPPPGTIDISPSPIVPPPPPPTAPPPPPPPPPAAVDI
jgi:hypothetical protein